MSHTLSLESLDRLLRVSKQGPCFESLAHLLRVSKQGPCLESLAHLLRVSKQGACLESLDPLLKVSKQGLCLAAMSSRLAVNGLNVSTDEEKKNVGPVPCFFSPLFFFLCKITENRCGALCRSNSEFDLRWCCLLRLSKWAEQSGS